MNAAMIAAAVFELLKLARSLGVEAETNDELTKLRGDSQQASDELGDAIDRALARHKTAEDGT